MSAPSTWPSIRKNPRTIYASLWATRRPPWSVYAPSNMPGGGLYKSTDGGDTWKQLSGGLPTDDFVGKIGIAVAPSNPNRLWAVVDDLGRRSRRSLPRDCGRKAPNAPKPSGGVYISDDAGATWRLVNNEKRLWGRGWYFGQIAVDPTNPDRAYDINTATYMTPMPARPGFPSRARPAATTITSSGSIPKTAIAWCFRSDQGTVVSASMARRPGAPGTTSPPRRFITSPPTIAFPIGSTARSRTRGAVGVSTWSRMGTLDFRNWEPTCLAGESDTVVPDPKDGNMLYGGGDQRCNQALNMAAPLGGKLPDAGSGRSESQDVDAAAGLLRWQTKRSTTRTSSCFARATAARPGRRSVPI